MYLSRVCPEFCTTEYVCVFADLTALEQDMVNVLLMHQQIFMLYAALIYYFPCKR